VAARRARTLPVAQFDAIVIEACDANHAEASQ
jgi:hypothetical protein